MHIAVLVFKRAKKRNISRVGRKEFWQLLLLFRENSCRFKDAKIRCPIHLHVKGIN